MKFFADFWCQFVDILRIFRSRFFVVFVVFVAVVVVVVVVVVVSISLVRGVGCSLLPLTSG